jgi:MinD-like ATPase involved in chromosome partitioning or flagellar assembly
LTTPDLSLHLGIPFHVRGLAHILQENAPLESAVFHHNSGMQVIPGNIHLNVLKQFEGKKLKRLLGTLEKQFDIILVDSAAGIGREAISAMKQCNTMLLVVNPEIPSVVNASKAIQVAKKHKVKPIGVVLNRVGRFKEQLSVTEIEPLLHKVPILGIVKESKRIPRTIKNATTIMDKYPLSRSARAYQIIAAKLLNTDLPRQSFLSKIRSFWAR